MPYPTDPQLAQINAGVPAGTIVDAARYGEQAIAVGTKEVRLLGVDAHGQIYAGTVELDDGDELLMVGTYQPSQLTAPP